MGDKTLIAWTDHTFNPWMGCAKVSAGCRNCYAESLTKNRMGLRLWGKDGDRQVTKTTWRKPPRWNRDAEKEGRRHRVFCASLCDVFEDHPVARSTRPRLWNLIRKTPWLDWQLLTKRPKEILKCLPRDWGMGWPNVWIGTSIEDMSVAHRADEVRGVPAVVRFISYEPALGPLDGLDLEGIDWVIYGGESGPGFRPEGTSEDPKVWARSMRDRCRSEGVAFFHKQSAAFRTEMGIELDGEVIHEFPIPRV